MLNGNGKLSSVSTTNVYRIRDGDVLLRTNTLAIEDELHSRVPLLCKTKVTAILRIIYVKSIGSYMLRV